MTSNTLPIQRMASTLIARATGITILFLQGGPTGAPITCRGKWNGLPITRTLEGVAIDSSVPTAWIPETQLYALTRDPQGGEDNMSPDYLRLPDGTTRRITSVKLLSSGEWKLEMTDTTT